MLRMLFVSLGKGVYLIVPLMSACFTPTHPPGERAAQTETMADAAARSLSDLPEELQGRVLSFLGVADLCRASAATLAWRGLAQECAEQPQAFRCSLRSLRSLTDGQPWRHQERQL